MDTRRRKGERCQLHLQRDQGAILQKRKNDTSAQGHKTLFSLILKQLLSVSQASRDAQQVLYAQMLEEQEQKQKKEEVDQLILTWKGMSMEEQSDLERELGIWLKELLS